VTLGTAFNLSINALINSGYTVSSYGNNQIYLSNVPMLNLMWPDAIMYYNAAGQLYGSQFVYSTPGYNMNQYNMAYTSLTSAYGAPYSLQNTASGIEVKIPTEILSSDSEVEFLHDADGSVSLLIKNVIL